MYTRLTGRGRHDFASRCTCTASSILVWEVSATCPSIPAVLRPALRCVACRTLSSVLLQLRSINFCRFLTAARSCSRSALKIRCRSRRTLSSWSRQSNGLPLGYHVLGSVHHEVSNLSLVPADPTTSCSKAHLPTSAPLSRPGYQTRYPASYP